LRPIKIRIDKTDKTLRMSDPVWVIAGGTGFLGRAILQKNRDTHVKIVILTRSDVAVSRRAVHQYENVSYVHWAAATPGDWMDALEGATALINLVGRSVNCRYTERNKAEIIASRVNATRILGYAIKRSARPPKVWINIASAAIFGDTAAEQKDETSRVGEGFSAEVCKRWEAAFYEISTFSTRKVLLRMGLVFQRNDGLLKPFSRMARLGLAGKMGTGEQYISWIHEDDFASLVATAIANDDWRGVINGVSPHPVTNKDFLRSLRLAYGVGWGLPQPAFMLKIGALLIGTEAELLLSGRRVVSKILEEKKFRFNYPFLEDALEQLLCRPS
jgi:uncharacterized protein (TIGR01777 family)